MRRKPKAEVLVGGKRKRYGKNRAMTDRQQIFVRKYTDPTDPVTFLNKKQSGIAAGFSEKNAGVCGYLTSVKPHVKAAIIEALHEIDVTPKYQAKKLKELMESNKAVYHEGLKIDENPDNEVRHKALVTSLKITDAISNLEDQVKGVEVRIAPELVDRLISIASDMRAMREKHSGQVIPVIPIKADS